MHGIILYKSKYGATRQYATWLSEALQLPAADAEQVTTAQLAAADFLVLGSSIYIGKLMMKQWLEQHMAVLANKPLFLFLVTATRGDKQETLNGYIQHNVPAALLRGIHPYFFPGRICYRKLSVIDKLKIRLGSAVARLCRKTLNISDFDLVQESNTTALVKDIQQFSNHLS